VSRTTPATGTPGSRSAVPSRPAYGVVVAKDVMVAMRDGVRLACDIYLPAEKGRPADGQWPTILGRCAVTP
jgi:predicted acyl esterase